LANLGKTQIQTLAPESKILEVLGNLNFFASKSLISKVVGIAEVNLKSSGNRVPFAPEYATDLRSILLLQILAFDRNCEDYCLCRFTKTSLRSSLNR